jgi:hypothetical protein
VSDPDFTLVVDAPPVSRDGSPPELRRNLEACLEAPGVFHRVVTYHAKSTAMACAAALRQGERGRPAGNWTIRAGRVEGSATDYGVWARFDS